MRSKSRAAIGPRSARALNASHPFSTVSAGSDLTALLPRFFNIRRGGYIAVIVALVLVAIVASRTCISADHVFRSPRMQPWRLLSSSSQFTLYLSAYSVFLSAIIGVSQ